MQQQTCHPALNCWDANGSALTKPGKRPDPFSSSAAFTNRHGTIQGGFLAAMLDSATGICALAALSADLPAVTKSFDTRFLKPAAVGPITARACVTERTDRDMAVQAALVDGKGVTVAEAIARLCVLETK